MPPKLTEAEMLQAYTDALRAIVTAVSWQVDPVRLYADLQALANLSDKEGHGPSAALIDVLAHTVKTRRLVERTKH